MCMLIKCHYNLKVIVNNCNVFPAVYFSYFYPGLDICVCIVGIKKLNLLKAFTRFLYAIYLL